ncbi:MAG: hypothetical protein KJ592_01985 [Nanoarchaeota archaeon]|nr:hypothetical protein [Nanoarchaeota archaeon]
MLCLVWDLELSFVGVVVFRCFGVSVFRCFGVSVFRYFGVSGFRDGVL